MWLNPKSCGFCCEIGYRLEEPFQVEQLPPSVRSWLVSFFSRSCIELTTKLHVYISFYVLKLHLSWWALLVTLLVAVISSRFLECKWEMSFRWRYNWAELSQQIKGSVTKSLRYQFMAPFYTNPDTFWNHIFFFTWIKATNEWADSLV